MIRYQLIKSSTSSGANYEEAQAGSSRKNFHNKVNISLKEISESNYWLVVIKAIDKIKKGEKELDWLINESEELDNILGSIVKKREVNFHSRENKTSHFNLFTSHF